MSGQPLIKKADSAGVWVKFDRKIAEAERAGEKSVMFKAGPSDRKKIKQRYQARGYKVIELSDLTGAYVFIKLS